MVRSGVKNMTEGNIPRLLLEFAAPMMAGNLFQQLYNMVDSVVVGNFVSSYALGAIGACSSLNNTAFGFCNGVSLGIGVVMSQMFGAGKEQEVRKTIINGTTVLLLVTTLLSVICVSMASPLLHLLQTPEEYIEQSILYYQITCIGLVGMAAYNAISAMLRALGDSRTPLLFLILASILNIVLDLVSVLWLQMGVAGVAIATIIAQAVSAVSCILYAMRTNPFFKLTKADLKLEKGLMLRCLKIGIPIGLQNSLISFSSVLLQRVTNGFGPDTATAYTMTVRLEQLIQQPYASLSAAISSFTGQNIGARKISRVQQSVKAGAVIVAIFSGVMCVVMHVFGRSILGIFGNDAAILDIAVKAIRITSCFYFPLGIIYLIRGLSNGAGDAVQAMLNGEIEICCRIGFALLFTSIPLFGMWGIWMTTAVTWCVTALECFIRYKQRKWMAKSGVLVQ